MTITEVPQRKWNMSRADRRARTRKKLRQRERLVQIFGLNQGTVYERHREKIEHVSSGFMRDGNVTHYTGNHLGEKTRDKTFYRPAVRFKHSGRQRADRLIFSELDFHDK